ncbi:MAG: hypothetical protein A2X84_14230 [Desulfuromonadaceae bacterium GWC2_58_13]|nr:MAG: hypothetical protein A2X84_14230 [Desulfuromonadaceae bacterium GWC2_58_13]
MKIAAMSGSATYRPMMLKQWLIIAALVMRHVQNISNWLRDFRKAWQQSDRELIQVQKLAK